jgi:hypothetical protein
MTWRDLQMAAGVGAFAASLAIISFGIEHPIAHALLHRATLLASAVGVVGALAINATDLDDNSRRRARLQQLRALLPRRSRP